MRGVKARGLFCAYDVFNLTADGERVGRAGLTRCNRRPDGPHDHVAGSSESSSAVPSHEDCYAPSQEHWGVPEG